ncbi:uncharacterized protein EV420DRAFT_673053 [Desarmillaria tabescens]|uniref:RanBP2-type domain-containing protein n=1 Tax=Armillaria tabescens TaxID=1929756 RepID=A0AA39NKM4_ARMTA|nr:uncharacterized protein EV420DRAFT_673053 [Desarmillaria tabescens]KAK0467228.1 hypothetical protein EV420DRAFT_673053 [Desarmillaria tabescens]
MSAIRSTPTRTHRVSPYVRREPQPQRPQPPKKSMWSLSGILHYLNPLRSRDDMEVDDEVSPPPPVADSSPPPTQPSPSAGQVTTQPSNTNNDRTSGASATPPAIHPPVLPQTVPATPANVSVALPISLDPALESVAAYLHDRRDQTIPAADADNLIDKLMQAAARESHLARFIILPNINVIAGQGRERERFRFSNSPSPHRGNSPALTANSEAGGPATPTKMLSKNPNGDYRWKGGGSAKVRPRGRYQSPAFGPSRATPDRLILGDSTLTSITDNTKADTKRRRVTNGHGSSFAEPSGASATPTTPKSIPFPRRDTPMASPAFNTSSISSANPPALNGSPPKLNGLPASTSTPRFRPTFVPPKPTTPAVPSPLRQAWGQTSPGSPETPPQTQKQSSAANFMAALIKDNTPTKKPDISNPYQTPGSIRATKSKRLRATGKPAIPKKQAVEEKKEKEKVYSPQAIIEATVPKGSKRSRPPTSATATKAIAAPKSFRVTVEDVEDEGDEDEAQRATKRMKPTVNGRTTTSTPSKDAEALKPEIKVNGVSESNPPAPSLFGSPMSSARVGRSSNAPKEPSKLRFSYQPETPSSPPPAPVLAAAVLPGANATPVRTFPFPAAMPPPTFSFPATPSPSSSSPTVSSPPGRSDPKAAALAVSPLSLPSFSFASTSSKPLSSESWDTEARSKAKATSTFELPTFSFPSSPVAGPSKPTAATPVVAAPAPTAPPKSFDWSAAGMKPPAKAAPGEWSCDACTLKNKDPAAEKCQICGERREKPKPAAPAATFNWAAAGMKPSSRRSGSMAMLCLYVDAGRSRQVFDLRYTPRLIKLFS